MQCSIDGAYFGTTFPHLLLMTYPMFRPAKTSEMYVPRVFGFKLHASVYASRDASGPPRGARQAHRALGGASTSRAGSQAPLPSTAAAAAAAAVGTKSTQQQTQPAPQQQKQQDDEQVDMQQDSGAGGSQKGAVA